MSITRNDLIKEARKYLGVKFSHQGRNPENGIDCGGLILVTTRELGLTEFEFLGYADFPTDGKFEELMTEHTDFLGFESKYPHHFDGSEFLPGDLLTFDYNNGEGTRHIALVSRWDGKRYRIVHAIPDYGVCECPLAHPFNNAKLKGWRIRNLAD